MGGMEPLLLIHLSFATFALLLGPVVLLRRRRDRRHRLLGRCWAATMLVTCVSSFGLRQGPGFSWLHGLSLFTLLTVTLGVLAARRRATAVHRRHMIGSYLGLVTAFGFAALVPGRTIPTMAADQPATLLAGAAAVALVVATLAASTPTRRSRARRPPRRPLASPR